MTLLRSLPAVCLILLLLGCTKEEYAEPKPAVPYAAAGTNQYDVEEFEVKLNADSLKANQTGLWTIEKGLVEDLVFFEDVTRPDSKFHGMPGETYELKWTVAGAGHRSESIVKVSFKPLKTSIRNWQPKNSTKFLFEAVNYSTGTWSIEGRYAGVRRMTFGGSVVPDLNAPVIEFKGYANTAYKLTWTTTYGSKSASATIELKTGDYLEEEALSDLQLELPTYRVKIENGHVVGLNLAASGIAHILSDTVRYPALQALTHLRSLQLQRSSISSFPVVFGEKYLALEYLDMESTALNSIPENIGNLKKLRSFRFYPNFGANLASLPDRFGDLVSLDTLIIRAGGKEGLQYIPESFSKLTNLRYVNCELNTVQKLPRDIGNLSRLEVLVIGTKEDLPASITKLARLRTLSIKTEKQNPVLPADFGDLAALDTLRLTGAYKSLPASFVNLNVRLLHLSTPPLTSVPENFGIMKKLEDLQMGGQIRTLPESFGNLENLRYFMTGGSLEYLPESFGKLKNLAYFGCQFGSLKKLPESFGQLESLKELTLLRNQLQELPPSFFDLPKIDKVTLSYNNLSTVPDDFGKLSKTLRQLLLYGNNYTEADVQKLKQLLPATAIPR